jgi:peptidoglycan/LPS O-acetylase OafA/YrhL
MVAVLSVFACHLWGQPRGGFIGVDVFFVISGFLITGNLLRTAENMGQVSFIRFYWNRVRRIVPAATVVLVLTYVVSLLVYMPFRAHQVGIDALFAFVFLSNWRFAVNGTDYFTATESTSPLQHYWSLSIEEQFYFVWPAVIFVIGVVVARRGWTHARRMQLAGGLMGIIVAVSLGWARYESATSPTWAYFSTFARIWELGVGALLATAVGVLARIPSRVKPWLSWAGLGLIAAGVALISDGSSDFPVPWVLLPVTGASLVIAAGVGGEPKYQAFLRNPVSTYIGDISYSLYLVHWPVIILLGMMDPGTYFSFSVLALSFGLSIASYRFVENPLRRVDWGTLRAARRQIVERRFRLQQSTQYAAVGALILVVVALGAYRLAPAGFQPATPAHVDVLAPIDIAEAEPTLGPLATALRGEIVEALTAKEWPPLDPSIESVINGPPAQIDVASCGYVDVATDQACTWGSSSAPTRVLLAGDSIAMSYAGALRELALTSSGQIQLRVEAMYGCEFSTVVFANADRTLSDACPARKQHTIDVINSTKPDVVIIANAYGAKPILGSSGNMTPREWAESMREIVDTFRGSTRKLVFLAAPPGDVNIRECYAKRLNTPDDCVSQVTKQWMNIASAEQELAQAIGATWIDSRLWFCGPPPYRCPSFVGLTPTKWDAAHMAPAYGQKIYPVIGESLKAAGVF